MLNIVLLVVNNYDVYVGRLNYLIVLSRVAAPGVAGAGNDNYMLMYREGGTFYCIFYNCSSISANHFSAFVKRVKNINS